MTWYDPFKDSKRLPLDLQGDISSEKCEEILQDLIRHIHLQGGYIFSNELATFYAKHAGHEGLIKTMTMRKFILQYPDRLSATTIEWPIYRIDLLDTPELQQDSQLSVEQSQDILQDLIHFIEGHGEGGSIGAEKLGPFYDEHPEHRTLLKGMGLSITGLCKQHPSRIWVGPGDGPHLRLYVLPWRQGQETKPASAAVGNEDKMWVVKRVAPASDPWDLPRDDVKAGKGAQSTVLDLL